MCQWPRNLTGILVVTGALSSWNAIAQSDSNPASKTMLEIEILMPQIGVNALEAQQWRQVFERLDIGVRIHTPLGGDKPDLSETTRGPFRIVRLTGALDRTGTLAFPGRSFSLDQGEKLREWLDELRVYGAQGSPEGKPLWGLTDAQFQELHKQLSQPVAGHVNGLSLQEVQEKIPVGSLPVVFHSTAKSAHEEHRRETFADELQGLSAGTSLAFLLSQQGLGFRPLREPSGTIQLVAQPLGDLKDPWPVGWPLEENKPRNQILPGLFEMVETGLESARVSDVLNAVETRSNVRILVDTRACLAKGLNLEEILVSYPKKWTAWALIVKSACVSSRLSVNYRQDEAGTGFLLIAPFVPYVAKERK